MHFVGTIQEAPEVTLFPPTIALLTVLVVAFLSWQRWSIRSLEVRTLGDEDGAETKIPLLPTFRRSLGDAWAKNQSTLRITRPESKGREAQ